MKRVLMVATRLTVATSQVYDLWNYTDAFENLYCGTMPYGFANSCARSHFAKA